MKYFAVFVLLVFSVSAQSQNLQVSPSTIIWYKVPNSVTYVQGIAVTNTSTKDVNGWFDTVTYPFSVEEGNNFTVAAGAIDSFHIKFVPNGAKGGNWQDTVQLMTLGAGSVGQFIINATRYNVDSGSVHYSTLDLTFRTIMAGTIDTEYVIAKNIGTTDLRVTADALKHMGPFARFGKSINSRVIQPDSSLSIGLQFMPLIGGSFRDTLFISSNDASQPNVKVSLHGIATPASEVRETEAKTRAIFPSVTQSTIFVQTGTSEAVGVRIVDLLGRECLRWPSKFDGEALDVSSLACGAYIAIMRSSSGTSTSRFVVSR